MEAQPVDEKGDVRSDSSRAQKGQDGEQCREERKRDSESSDDDSDTELLKSMAKMEVSEEGLAQHKGTGFIYDKLFTRHKCEWDPGYAECPERIQLPFMRCKDLGLVERCTQIPMRYATEDQIQWHHSLSHLELAKQTTTMSSLQRKELAKKYDSWYANQATFECSLAAAGSCIELMDQILQEKITNGFAMVRPPGHHAMHSEFCGYCVFNNVAFAASHAINHGIERVLIVDWDVHHGQGTQQMFYEDPRVMYFSIHRYEYGEFWPNLRESDYDFIGDGRGRGYNINVPLNKTGLGDSDFMAIMQQLLMPLALEFSPEVVIISSGYDAAIGCPEFMPQVVVVSCGLDSAIGDEKGEMMVSPATYAHFIHMLSSLCQGRLCTVLEGGYCLQSLSEGCAMTLRSLLGDPCPQLPPMSEPSDSVISSILNVVKVLCPFWKCFTSFEMSDSEQCPFDEVNSLPPREGVVFMTPDNRPSEYEIMGCYPKQSLATIDMFRCQIDRLIAETSLSKAPHRTCFVFDAAMRKHRNLFDGTHPERPKRISCIYDKHREWGLLKRCLQLESRIAVEDEILAVHSKQHLEAMKESALLDEDALRSRPREMKYNSVYVCQDTYHSALLSAGCVLQVTEAVLSGKAQSGVAVVRPPGHHAECSQAMGFCFFNNVAVAAAYSKDKFGLRRILILDWDVHHGNATQHMFYNDPSVLYISLHRYENGFYFPGSADAGHQYVGQNDGEGFNVNIPWNQERMGDAEYMAAFQRIVMPIAYEFAPELVLVSAGFDAAAGDYLGGYKVMPECYGHMTYMLSSLANGRVVLALEGGYNATAISVSMATCTSVLLGDPCPLIQPRVPNNSALKTINDVLTTQKQFWRSLKFAVTVPSMCDEPATSSVPLAQGVQSQCCSDDLTLACHSDAMKKEAEMDQVAFRTGAAAHNTSLASSQPTQDRDLVQTVKQTEIADEAGGSGTATAEGATGGEELLGAVGGSWRPNTVADVLRMEGVDQLFAVQPLPWCPHLASVQPLPPGGLNTSLPCQQCGDRSENWVCLICYQVFCSRYVQEHMLFHSVEETHLVVLSFSDLSVWCYACNDYIDNQITYPMKNSAHRHKFGEPLANTWQQQ